MTDRYVKIRKALEMGPTPGPWVQDGDGVSAADEDVAVAMCCPSDAEAAFIAACDPDTIQALLEERDGLTAENARLREALHVVSECGGPCKVILYDEEGIEGWRWTHPDGREWTETGEWSKDPPLHPVARAALAKENSDE